MAVPLPDENEKQAFLEMLKSRRSRATAAGSLGYLPATFETAMRQDPEFAELVIGAEQVAIGSLEDVMMNRAAEGNITALMATLKALNPAKWGDKSQVTHVGPGGGPIQLGVGVSLVLRDVLTTPDTRASALEMVDSIPAIEATAREAT